VLRVIGALETPVRDWVNADSRLVGTGVDDSAPLNAGAFTLAQRSPAFGAYAVITRDPAAQVAGPFAEDSTILGVRMAFDCYAGTIDKAEAAAAAVTDKLLALNGCPEPLAGSGLLVLVSDNVTGPVWVPQPPDSGETYCFTTSGDLWVREL
jgi:hypothetical protein